MSFIYNSNRGKAGENSLAKIVTYQGGEDRYSSILGVSDPDASSTATGFKGTTLFVDDKDGVIKTLFTGVLVGCYINQCNLPAMESFETLAFEYSRFLTDVTFPKLKKVLYQSARYSTFKGLSLPAAETCTLDYCNLDSLDIPVATAVSLQHVNFPQDYDLTIPALTAGTQNLCAETRLHSLILPELTSIQNYGAFRSATITGEVYAPKLADISRSNGFMGSARAYTFGTLTKDANGQWYNNKTYGKWTRKIVLGAGSDINVQTLYWTADDVIAEGKSAQLDLISNLREGMYDTVQDHTGEADARSITAGWIATLSASTDEDVANAVIELMADFSAKGWSLGG